MFWTQDSHFSQVSCSELSRKLSCCKAFKNDQIFTYCSLCDFEMSILIQTFHGDKWLASKHKKSRSTIDFMSRKELLNEQKRIIEKTASNPDNHMISLTHLNIKPEQKSSDRGMLQGWDRLERFFQILSLHGLCFFGIILTWNPLPLKLFFVSVCSKQLTSSQSFLLWVYSNDFFHPINSSLLILTTLVFQVLLHCFCWQE